MQKKAAKKKVARKAPLRFPGKKAGKRKAAPTRKRESVIDRCEVEAFTQSGKFIYAPDCYGLIANFSKYAHEDHVDAYKHHARMLAHFPDASDVDEREDAIGYHQRVNYKHAAKRSGMIER